jgi:DNA-binding NtrC family response regulator
MSLQTASLKLDTSTQATPRIFVVDDEIMVGEVVEAILNLEGFEARYFSDPTEALKAFRHAQIKPELLLSDYVMTPMNGMELIHHCKEDSPKLHTILYSGNVGEDIVRRYQIKPDAFLTKPFLPKTLVGLVQKMLSH